MTDRELKLRFMEVVLEYIVLKRDFGKAQELRLEIVDKMEEEIGNHNL